MILALVTHPAWACGGLVTTSSTEKLAAADAVQAILTAGTDEDGMALAEVVYRVHYTGNADDFGWIIPIPGTVSLDGVTTAQDAVFDILATATTPQVTTYTAVATDGSPGCCTPDRKSVV